MTPDPLSSRYCETVVCRSVFAAPAGWLILSADWSQAEVGIWQLSLCTQGCVVLPQLTNCLQWHCPSVSMSVETNAVAPV